MYRFTADSESLEHYFFNFEKTYNQPFLGGFFQGDFDFFYIHEKPPEMADYTFFKHGKNNVLHFQNQRYINS